MMEEIKLKNGNVLVPVISGRTANCAECNARINGGDECYSEQIRLGDKLLLKPMLCKTCAGKRLH